jgi:tetratricopeptide (TPR) repeat protein
MIEVGPMAQTDALTLLEKKLGPLPDLDVAADLVEVLDLVPLAISQVAAYIQARAPLSSLEKYLAEFREGERKRSRLLEHDAGDLRRDGGASNAILTTWQISFDHIRSQRRSAADLLSLMSFFDRQGIPMWVLRPSRIAKDAMRAKGLDKAARSTPKWKSKSSIPWLQGKVKKLFHDITTGRLRRKRNAGDGESDDSSSSATDGGTDDGADDDIDSGFEDDVAMLRDYCLIATNEAGDEFEMHTLVQLSTRRWLEASGQQETFKQQCIERIAAFFPTGEYDDWATCRSLFAHVQVAVGYQPSEDTVETWATLLYNGGRYARLQGKYEVAQQMLGKARKVREKKLGKEDVATLASISSLATVLLDRGCWEESEELFRQVMETYKTKLGADHLDTLASIGNLALVYSRQGRWEEAEKLEVQVMEMSKTKLGADHLDTLTCMNNLASTLWHQGRWEEAEELGVQVLEMSKTKLGADHPLTLTRMANLAFTWKEQGRHIDALALMKDCAEAQQRVFGAKHLYTLSCLAAIAEWSS